jgi:hypothetical protein
MRVHAIVPFVLVGSAAAASAQSARPFSVQASPFWTAQRIIDANASGFGVETQVRYSRGAASVGVGYQYTNHVAGDEEVKVSGVFAEPRYTLFVGSPRLIPYLAGRAARLRQTNNFASSSNGYAVGGGGGVILTLSDRVNLDFGAALLRQSMEDATLPNGLRFNFGSFTGYAAKAGLSVSFGRLPEL